MLSPAERSLIDALVRRVAALERSPVQGQGVSTLYGGTQVRTVQLGFPAELTSTWDSSTGYDWKRLVLSGVAMADPNLPVAGDHAATPGDDETLPSGTRGWMEPAPDGSPAWVFVPEGVGGLTTMTVVTDACLSGDPPVLKLTKRALYVPSAWPIGAEYCEEKTGCSGPCDDAGDPVDTACCAEDVPARLWLCVSGDCPCLDGPITLDYDTVLGTYWVGFAGSRCGTTVSARAQLVCGGGTVAWEVQLMEGPAAGVGRIFYSGYFDTACGDFTGAATADTNATGVSSADPGGACAETSVTVTLSTTAPADTAAPAPAAGHLQLRGGRVRRPGRRDRHLPDPRGLPRGLPRIPAPAAAMTHLLTVPGYVTPHYCEWLRTGYTGAMANGLTPRGRLTTDTPLAGVIPSAPALADAVRQRLEEFFPQLPPLRPDYVAYTRCAPGGRHPLHADAVKPDGSPNHTPHRVASAMLYLTDHGTDHAGGVLRFPGLGVEVEPRAGLLVGFLTSWDFRHEVTPVTAGERDAVAFWFRDATRATPAAPARVAPAAPCEHRGGPAPPPNGLPTARAWHRCGHPAQPLGPVVCGCRGCGPRCPGYAPDD